MADVLFILHVEYGQITLLGIRVCIKAVFF